MSDDDAYGLQVEIKRAVKKEEMAGGGSSGGGYGGGGYGGVLLRPCLNPAMSCSPSAPVSDRLQMYPDHRVSLIIS